jgi:hypothetical protein
MFRQKEYTPIGPKEDPIDSDPHFADFSSLSAKTKDLQTLKNELWSGISAGFY